MSGSPCPAGASGTEIASRTSAAIARATVPDKGIGFAHSRAASGTDRSSDAAGTVAISNSTTITVTLTVGGTGGTDQLTIGNTNAIQVRPTAGTPLDRIR